MKRYKVTAKRTATQCAAVFVNSANEREAIKRGMALLGCPDYWKTVYHGAIESIGAATDGQSDTE